MENDPHAPRGEPDEASEPGSPPSAAEVEDAVEVEAAHEAEKSQATRDEAVSATSYIGPDRRPKTTSERDLGDFTTKPAVLRLVPLAVLIGALSAGISLALLAMIGFLTNVLYYQRLSAHLASPNANTLGAISLVIPIGGGLIVGLMARYGSEQIRGHGIHEAMENILIDGSKTQPRLASLKPISRAISIGTGGPFGAEGPIILT
ncbi:MAG: chloride channel protein, partial [Acidimicrobiales bacterium]